MRRIVVSACVVVALVSLEVGPTWAQQHPELTVVNIRGTDDPSVWLMDIESSDATWSIHVGAGCENAVEGPAALLVDGIREQWLVLPDATPGTCHIDQADLVTDPT